MFNIHVLPNENKSHRLNTTLRAMVEIAGDQPDRATKDKAVVRKSSGHANTILVLCPPITTGVTVKFLTMTQQTGSLSE